MTASLPKSKQPEYRNKYEKMLRKNNPEFADRQRKSSRAWRKENKELKSFYDWAYHILQKYNMTVAQYETMLANQGGGCKICGRKAGRNRLPVDHDHSTGRVRGILCTPCNRVLGILESNILTVVKYLDVQSGTDDVRVRQSSKP